MAKRGISDAQRTWLVRQLDDWQSHGLLSANQAAPILDLYETPVELTDRKRSIALVTLMGIAALMIGLSVLLLVGYNWKAMPAAMKLSIIFGAILGTHGIAAALRFKRHATLLSEVVFFLGCLFYGIGIFLVAQIFHINAHYPNGVWWWALGVLPIALCLDTMLLHTLIVALLAIWCGMEILDFHSFDLWLFGGRWPNGAYSLPLLVLPGMIWAYRKRSVTTVSLYVAVISWWLLLQTFAWEIELASVYFIGAMGGLMLGIAESHAKSSPFSIPYRFIGVLLTAGTLLCLSFYDFNEAALFSRIYYSWWRSSFTAIAFTMAITVAIAILSTLIVYVVPAFNRDQRRRRYLPFGLVLLIVTLLFWNALINDPLLPTILANGAMIFLAFWLMSVGFRDDRIIPFAAGVMYFLLWTVVRYIDLFGNFGGMLGAAFMFFLCGGTLFGAALYWRNRRQKQYG